MMGIIEKIKKETTWTHPVEIAEKVIEIINEDGKLVRYVIGRDAESLINSVYSYQDNHERMDKAIGDIFDDYMN